MIRPLLRRTRSWRSRCGSGLVAFHGSQAAPSRPFRNDESIQHGLRAQLIVERIAVHAQQPGRLGNVAAIRVHRCHDVLSFERLDSLLERDSVSNQFTNDLRQTIVDTQLEFLNGLTSGRATFYYAIEKICASFSLPFFSMVAKDLCYRASTKHLESLADSCEARRTSVGASFLKSPLCIMSHFSLS